MKKSIWWVVGIVVILVLLIVLVSSRKATTPATNVEKPFTIGAVLPLSGAAALWGETVKNGMELALEGRPGIVAIYEDSKSTAADGVSAYNSLQNKGVDLTVSETSLVAVPLAKIALERKQPLLVTLVATDHSKIVNEYTTRYYTDPTNYAMPAFNDPLSPVIKAKKIALLHRNDELGVAVKDKIVQLSSENKKELVIQESFAPNEKDYRTLLTKIKNSKADALVFIVANPIEAVGIVKMANEIGIGMPMIEASAVFADLDTRKQAGTIQFYSTSYDFSLPGKAQDFKAKYQAKFNKEPNFGAAFGYDIANLSDSCKAKKESIKECLAGTDHMDGVAGTATQILPGDFVVKMHIEKVN